MRLTHEKPHLRAGQASKTARRSKRIPAPVTTLVGETPERRAGRDGSRSVRVNAPVCCVREPRFGVR